MSKIKLTGDSSGYVEISAPSAAGNNTLELPASGSKIVVSDGSDNVNIAGIATIANGLNVISGNVDIGKETSGRKTLTLNSQDNGAAILFRADAATRARIEVENGSTDLVFGVETAVTPTTRLRIDSSGRVQMPYQPCFHAAGNQATTFASSQVVPFNVSLTNNGGHYSTSTYRFTAPVAGYYFFTFHAILGPDNSGSAVAHIRRNANVVATIHRNTSSSYMFPWEQGACSAVLYLNVSDYVDCNIASGTIYCGANITGGEVYSAFNGHLIG